MGQKLICPHCNQEITLVVKRKRKKTEIIKQENGTQEIMELFYEYNPSLSFGNKTQRKACEDMIKKFGKANVIGMVGKVLAVQGEKFAPRATTPYAMWTKIADFAVYFKSKEKGTESIDLTNLM